MAALAASPYLYHRFGEEVRRRVEARLADHYKHLDVRVRQAQLIEGEGIEIRGLAIREPNALGPQAEIAYFDEIFLACKTDLKELIQGTPDITHVRIRRPTLRATRRQDGTWSVAKLVPWPRIGLKTPTGVVENCTLEVFDPLKNPSSTLTLRDMHLQWAPPQDPNAPRALDLQCTMTGDHLERIEWAGRYEPDSGRLNVAGAVRALDLSPELRAALPGDCASQLAVLAPLRAQAELAFELRRDPQAQPEFHFDVTGQLSRGRFDDPRMPYPLNDLKAAIRVNNEGFEIRDFVARNGSAELRLAACGAGFTGGPMSLEATGKRLRLDDQLVSVIPESLRSHWFKYLPQGEIDADLKLWSDGKVWKPEIAIRCRDVSFTYHKFPYRLAQGGGHISLRDDVLKLQLTAYSGAQPVRIDGQIFHPGEHFTGSVVVEGDNIPFDEKLMQAMPDKAREVLRSLNPQGTLNFYTRHWRDDGQRPDVHQHVQVGLNRCSLCYEKFPYPLSNIRGTVEVLDDHWTFRNLEGLNDTGYVTCQGELGPTEHGPRLALTFVGQKVPLEEELRDSLPPNMQRVWTGLRPHGLVDVTTDIVYWSVPRSMEVRVQANPRDETVSIEPVCFPYRLDKLRGGVRYERGRVQFDRLEAVHGRTTVATGGSCDFTPDDSWKLRLENLAIDRFEADHELVAALPEGMRHPVSELKPTGKMNVRGLLEFTRAGEPGAPLKSGWDLTLDMHQSSADCGFRMDNIHGSIRFTGGSEANRFGSHGELALDSVTYKNFQLTDVRGPVWIDNSRVLGGAWTEQRASGREPRRLTANIYGGTLVADTQITLGATQQCVLKAQLFDADMAQFARENLIGRQQLNGKVQANLDLAGTTRGTHTLGGSGSIRLRDADIYELPLMVALLKILSVKPPDVTAFSRSDIDFRVQGEHVLFDRINFNGDAISLIGQGQLNLDMQTNLTFHAMVGRDEFQVPILRNVLGEASQQLMQIHVEGTLDNPVMRKEAFPGFSQALQQLQADLQMNKQPAQDRAAQQNTLPKR